MPKVDLAAVEETNRTGYPPVYAGAVAGRWVRKLGPVTGLSDFGAMDFVERLDVMLASAREDAGLNALGRKLFHDDMVRYAANRLRL